MIPLSFLGGLNEKFVRCSSWPPQSAVTLQASLQRLAQTYPSHTVRIVVPFGAGSLTDILARMIAEDGSKKWGQQVIVENRPGLPGTIAVSRAEPDGSDLDAHLERPCRGRLHQ